MPIDYTQYPRNWYTEIRPAALIRANWKCEHCGLSSGSVGYRDKNKIFIHCDQFMLNWCVATNQRTFKIVLAVAHIDHNVDNNEPANLKVLCQKCHLDHDRQQHQMKRKINAAKKRQQPGAK